MPAIPAATPEDLPYSFSKLDDLMEAAGIDILIATSKHNTQYLLGGYRFIFFSAMDAIGHSRYLPVVLYRRGKPDDTAYIGNKMEGGEHHNHPFWVPNFRPVSWTSRDSIAAAIEHLKKLGLTSPRIGIEPGFLPADSYQTLTDALPDAQITDATHALERLRAVKTPSELALLKRASEGITAAMQATINASQRGRHQIRNHRTPAPRGNQSRAAFRILPADPRPQPQPRSIGSEMAKGRGAFHRLRRQPRRLYRRHLPHGHAWRTRHRTAGSAGRGRSHSAGRLLQGPRRHNRRRDDRPRPERPSPTSPTTTAPISSPTAWA